MTPDSVIKTEDLAKRAVAMGQKTISTVEHGYFGSIFDYYETAQEYGLKLIFGIEYYFVKDRFDKDRTNSHLLVVAKNEEGRREMTSIMSEANKTGFFYHPRIDEELLFSLTPENVIVTTACLSSPLNSYSEDEAMRFLSKAKEHFGDNFYIEVQPHTNIKQVEFQKKILKYNRTFGFPLILGVDSHYIKLEDDKIRDLFLKGKNIHYPAEDGFTMDYPSISEIVDRLKLQGVLTDAQIEEAITNTLVARDFEGVSLDKEIKMPSLYPDKSHEEKMVILKKLINEKWVEDRKEIPKEKWSEYLEAIREEIQIIEKTKMEDYFLLNYDIVKRAVEEYDGVITSTGRGCFVGTAPIRTKKGLKPIKDVKIGDEVITSDGKWEEVYHTFEYDLNSEDLIEIEYQTQGVRKEGYQVVGTLDHKVLVRRNGENVYIPLSEIEEGEYLVSPKSKVNEGVKENIVIDLAKYNSFGYEYDDEYIYEVVNSATPYSFSPTDCAKKGLLSENIAYQLSSGKFNWDKARVETLNKIEKFFSDSPFKSQEDYMKYADSKKYIKSLIPRYLTLDKEMNEFIGLLYGDGWVRSEGRDVALAVNKTSKYEYNRDVFYSVAKRLGIETHERVYNNGKNLIQLYMKSNIFKEFIIDFVFINGHSDVFNFDLVEKQSKKNIEGLVKGMIMSDGSTKGKWGRYSFDSTSPTLIEGFRQASSIVGTEPMSVAVRDAHIDSRGYSNKESYKVRWYSDRKSEIPRDDNNWYLKVTRIKKHKNVTTKVYDLSVRNNPSFVIGNIAVHNSAPSFYVNKLLGLTDIDRISAPITLYPTRFMSKSRILETRSLPDIDLNIADPEPFRKASKDILGEDNSEWMVAYGTMQEAGAFKNYARSVGIDFNEANQVSDDLDRYKNDKKWGEVIKASSIFRGVIDSVSPHACSHLLLPKPNISETTGTIKVKDEYVTLITSSESDDYKYLKNDYLSVTVWKIISDVYKMIGKPRHTIRELEELVEGDDKVWKLYRDGIVATLNQTGTKSGKPQVMQYKPTSVAELSMWVASIRPGFASLKQEFFNRKEHKYGIDSLDDVLSETNGYMIFQENIMAVLMYAGISEDRTYSIIKGISKKVPSIVDNAKEEFYSGFLERTSREGYDEEFAKKTADEVWKVMEDASDYSFNASHAYSVALDSVYGAYLKAYYPLEYYTVILNIYQNDSDKIAEIEQELDYFGIKIGPIVFGGSRANYTPDKETNTIFKGIWSIKYMNEKISEELFELSQTEPYLNKEKDALDLFLDLIENTSVNSRQTEILINLDFFAEFGKAEFLLNLWNTMNNKGMPELVDEKYADKKANPVFYSKNHIDKTKAKRIENLRGYVELLKENPPAERTTYEKIMYEKEFIGHATTTFPELPPSYVLITDLNLKYTPILEVYQLSTGKTFDVKIKKNKFYDTYDNPIVFRGNTIRIIDSHREYGKKLVDGKWYDNKNVTWIFIDKMSIITG